VPVVDSRRGEFTYYGSPQLSPDGSRIVYDASPGKHFGETHLFLAQLEGDSLKHVDLGVGNCPAFSPDGKLIAFLLNPGPGERGTPGLWIMNADGSRRQRLTDGSIPEWSPDEMRILNATFSSPVEISFLNPRDGQRQAAEFPMHRIYSIP